MNTYNKKLLDRIYEICEKDGSTINVGPEYYNHFLNMSDKSTEVLITYILRDRVDHFNRKIFFKEFKNDEEIYIFVMDFLDMIARGIMCLREEDGKLCILKPVGPLPDSETEKKIDVKIKSTEPLIRKVILKSLRNKSR